MFWNNKKPPTWSFRCSTIFDNMRTDPNYFLGIRTDISGNILRINPLMLSLKYQSLYMVAERTQAGNSMEIAIVFGYIQDNEPNTIVMVFPPNSCIAGESYIEIEPVAVAQHLSDKVNEMERERYANCL